MSSDLRNELDRSGLATDVGYAIRQVRRALGLVPAQEDCLFRALDALERVQDSIDSVVDAERAE